MGTPIKLQVVKGTGRISAFLLIRLKFLLYAMLRIFFESRKEASALFVQWIGRVCSNRILPTT